MTTPDLANTGASTIDAPRSPYARTKRGINLEKWGWIYMRVSGVMLVVLIFGHLFVNLVLGTGVSQIDFAFVAGKLSDPFWIVWDTLLLWLALLHGANGIRTIINDYVSTPRVRGILIGALGASTAVLLILGTLVIYTFDPCPAGADPALVASFCGDLS
ncbi:MULTISPECIES: succinate dehydrogenase hydrophobic membrane anchor subunit [Microcella]|uniref:succinate dehydrogenase hydrophobic membrane anchor subunit n=1 Tax=Microcella TaxID=337004 RepID=UPI0015CF5894|nr:MULTISPECIES: succinate dehydrogenase hydrophobic membrane anchor subunit [Microcella]MBU1249939.1 succinate dehydrogenase hydrophobic membrane anchor subunit [Actinomycetota bacterium]MBU1609281.1 succinate dehydrogenase hydrophobic membrane anchor subunit [Actinomycetota bacterium]MBU2314913.1 succinate dehydrogenase hydrophobic membrane anchor subunit [Actinomycetota bacterium]MBU2383984.1 succinate dehydrogenase hydrophobic membrane anchor subunit [Actinomycetota bacterium]QOD93296.1 su